MKTKYLLTILLVTAILALVAACGGAAQPAAPAEKPAEKPAEAEKPTEAAAEKPAEKPTEAAAEKPAAGSGFKMGLLVPGSANDQGWNQIAYDALKRVEKELGAEISYVELEQNPAAFEKAFRDYASQGYQLVLGHGFEFQDPALTVAKEFPDTVFFISSSRIHEGKVIGLNTDSSQPFFLMGVIAAKMGQKAGIIGGMEIPPIAEAIAGFTNGAHYVNPDFPVSSVYIGNFTDTAAAKEAAVSMIKDGADFVIPDADVAGLGVYQAVSEAGPNIKTFGAFGDFTDKAPQNILGNYIANYGQGIVNMAKEVKEGTFKPAGNVEFGLANADVLQLKLNDKVPADVAKFVEEVTAKIAAGEINTLTGEAAQAAAPAPAAGEGKPFKVGLLSPGPVNDKGWNEQAYNALLTIEKELGAEISYVELEESPAAFEKAFRDYASQGYQVIIGHGFQFEDAAKTVAPEFPDTVFVISSSAAAEPNVVGVNLDSHEPFYLLGVIAASMGKGAGLVGGVEIPPISNSFTGFINGAKSVNKDFPVAVTYLGNWTDIAAAKEAALGQISEGADFLAPNANIAGQGIFQAAQESKDVWAFGTYGDQTALAPQQVVANYVADYGRGLVKVAQSVRDGTFQPNKNIAFGLETPDVVWVTYNEKADKVVPKEVRAAVEEAQKKIVAGEIDVLAPIK